MGNKFLDLLERVLDSLERVLNSLERVFGTGSLFNRVIAFFFLVTLFYVFIFGKGFEGINKFVCGFAFAWSLQQLFPDVERTPRRKRIRQVTAREK